MPAEQTVNKREYKDHDPGEYDNWAKNHGSIYGEDGKIIADVGAAQDVAVLENAGHMNPDVAEQANEASRLVEQQRAREAFLGGLTEEQKGNQAFMEKMKEKFPDAFTTFTDSKGRDVMMLNIFRGSSDLARPIGWEHSQLLEDVRVFTVYGAFEFHQPQDYDKYQFVKQFDWTKTLDLLAAFDDKNPTKASHEYNDETSFVYIHPSDILKKDFEVPFFSLELRRCDLGDERQRKLFKGYIDKSIKVKEYIDEFEKVKASKPEGADLANLF